MLTALMLALLPGPASANAAENGDRPGSGHWTPQHWTVKTSLYTRHWDPEPEHNNHQRLFGFEAQFDRSWLVGAAAFRNSYDQSSQFLYAGRKWDLSDSGLWYAKLMAGLIHGYKGAYEDKIPLNGFGVAPAVIPALGIRYQRALLEAHFGGFAVMMISAGLTF